MVKKIIWSALAQTDRKNILTYWKERNKSSTYPIKLNSLFKKAVTIIAKFPKIGKPSGYRDTRIKIIQDYFLIYKEYEDIILIITLWDSRQNPLNLEKILK